MRKERVNNEGAVKVLMGGGVVEFGSRYYRYNRVSEILQQSDYSKDDWVDSKVKLDDFKTEQNIQWRVVEKAIKPI